jgi:predicted Zn-dependent protease
VRPGRQRIAVAAVVLLGAGVPGVTRAHPGLHELSRAASAEVARHPQDPEAHLQRARVHQLAREWDAALAELEVAAVRGADPVAVGAARGAVHLDAGRPHMAKTEFDRVLARRPDAHGIRFERGRAWLALGRAGRAAKDFGDAIAGLPEPRPEHVIAQRDALVSLGRRREALRALDAGMARVGAVASLQLPAIDLELELGRHDAALRRLDALLGQSPKHPAWIARRGEILERAGKAPAAREEYVRALALLAARRRGASFTQLERRLHAALAPPLARNEEGQ